MCFSEVKEPHFFIINDLTSLDLDELERVVQRGLSRAILPKLRRRTSC